MFPADRNGVVGIKPTVGLTSRHGIIPESSSLDTVGTFGRNVEDAVIALDSIVDACENGNASPSYCRTMLNVECSTRWTPKTSGTSLESVVRVLDKQER